MDWRKDSTSSIGTTSNLPEQNTDEKTSTSDNSNTKAQMSSSSLPDITPANSLPSAASSEPSGPPSPTSGPIPNFGEISLGIYRSSFPGPRNIEHLQSLQLKTLITLVTTPFAPEVEAWIASSGITHYRFNITAHKKHDDKISTDDVAAVMKLLTDETKQPMLMHCNKGRHRTGCMTAAFCKLRGVDEERVVADYHEFAQPKARELDIAFISGLRNGELRDAIDRLEKDAVEPVRYQSLHNGLMSVESVISVPKGIPIQESGISIIQRGQERHRKQGPINIGRVALLPVLPPSPPSSFACKGLGFSVQELVDALCRIRENDTATPPATPPKYPDFDP